MDFSRYFPPGVYTESIPGPIIGVQAGTTSAVAIFGKARGYQTDLETIVIPQDFTPPAGSPGPVASATLRQKGISLTTLVITDTASGVVYVAPNPGATPAVVGDYVINATTGPSGTPNSYDTTYTITRVGGAALAAGTSVQVTYQFTNANYYAPQRLYSPTDVLSLYGPPFDATGTIISELTLAAQFAFINGAAVVITVAVGGTGTVTNYTDALATLEGIGDISIVCCASGTSGIFPFVRDHVVLQSAAKNERRAILGTDGAVTTINSASRITTAGALLNARVALVSPSVIQYFNPVISATVPLGSQFLAAAVAGLAVSQSPALPLTHKQVAGFVSVNVASDAQKSLETQGGLMVVDSNNTVSALRIRHGVTTNPATLVTREWTILGQQDAMTAFIRSYFESANIIGSIITDLTLSSVQAAVSSALAALVSNGIIQAYAALAVRQDPLAFDAIDVSYQWQPSLPLNYIVVQYTLNVATGTTTPTTTA